LTDAKNAGEVRSWYDVGQSDPFTMRYKIPDIVAGAGRQVRAIEGTSFTRIEWRVADSSVADALQALFDVKHLNIRVVPYP